MTYNEAKELFSRCRNKQKGYLLPGRQGSTRLFYYADRDCYTISYHNTNVVKIYSDNTYELQNRGYFTKTTKERIQTYAPVNIVTVNRQWYVYPKGITYWHKNNLNKQVIFKFRDGIVVDNNGMPKTYSPNDLKEIERLEKNRRARERRRLQAPKISMLKLITSIDKLKG